MKQALGFLDENDKRPRVFRLQELKAAPERRDARFVARSFPIVDESRVRQNLAIPQYLDLLVLVPAFDAGRFKCLGQVIPWYVKPTLVATRIARFICGNELEERLMPLLNQADGFRDIIAHHRTLPDADSNASNFATINRPTSAMSGMTTELPNCLYA